MCRVFGDLTMPRVFAATKERFVKLCNRIHHILCLYMNVIHQTLRTLLSLGERCSWDDIEETTRFYANQLYRQIDGSTESKTQHSICCVSYCKIHKCAIAVLCCSFWLGAV